MKDLIFLSKAYTELLKVEDLDIRRQLQKTYLLLQNTIAQKTGWTGGDIQVHHESVAAQQKAHNNFLRSLNENPEKMQAKAFFSMRQSLFQAKFPNAKSGATTFLKLGSIAQDVGSSITYWFVGEERYVCCLWLEPENSERFMSFESFMYKYPNAL